MEKPTSGEKFRALLATGRVANLPTVWSNVLVGFWFASAFAGEFFRDDTAETARLLLFAITGLIASCIYIAGCMLGDAVDVYFDRENRPNRPIPQGVISSGTVKFSAFCLFALALFGIISSTFISYIGAAYLHEDLPLTEIIDLFSKKSTLNAIQIHELIHGCVLIACVMAYAYFHKRIGKTSLFLMAACRFMLVLYAISVAHKSFFSQARGSSDPMHIHLEWCSGWMFLLAAAVGGYTLLLSWVASTESDNRIFQKRTILSGLLLTIPVLTYAFQILVFKTPAVTEAWGISEPQVQWQRELVEWGAFYAALAALYTWLTLTLRALKTSKPTFVSRALAGFCLLDAAFIAPFFPGIALICVGLFLLALLLQRITPAT